MKDKNTEKKNTTKTAMRPILPSEVPGLYVSCFADCPAAETCLHAVAGQVTDKINVTCFNPRLLTTRGTDCPFYRSAEPVTLHYGFTNFLRSVTVGKLPLISAELQRIFYSRRQFYRARNGDFPISPQHRQEIDELAARFGLPTPVQYDKTEEAIDWCDFATY